MSNAKLTKKNITIVGNKKRIKVTMVEGALTVIGNQSKVDVAHNKGKVEIIGNNCCLNIQENRGEVILIGNNGVLTISNFALGDNVNCIGKGSRIERVNKSGGGGGGVSVAPVPTTTGAFVNRTKYASHLADLNVSIDLRCLQNLPT